MKPDRVRCARVYDRAAPEDGTRVLVDRLWPRGVRKDAPGLDGWIKEAAPSAELRNWYHHDPDRFPEFRERYRQELDSPSGREALDHLAALAERGTLTLLTATKELERSHVRVLAEALTEGLTGRRAGPQQGGGYAEGGEEVCYLARVCPECGALSDSRPPTVCSRCGTEIPAV